MSVNTRFGCSVLCSVVLLFGAVAVGADWPCWRGPNHDGVSAERGIVGKFGESGPKRLWELPIGSAFSSTVCVDDKAFTCGTRDGKQVVFCIDAKTGKEVWSGAIEDHYGSNWGDGARATPTYDAGKVYILGAHGRLVCFDAGSGKEVWSHELNHPPKWGYSGSVLVEDRMAIVSAGDDGGSLAAYDKGNGKLLWKCGSDKAGYATPYPFTFRGKRYVCGFTGKQAIVAEIESGKEVLTIPWETDWDVNAATPFFHKGHLFLTSGYDTGCALFKLDRKGDRLKAEEVWRSKVLLNKFQTPVLYKGNLYACDQKAFKCVEFMTGKSHWEKRKVKHGTIVLASDNLILLTEGGELQIGPASPNGFVPTATAQVLKDRCWTVPTLSNGRLFVRNLEKMVCLDLQAER